MDLQIETDALILQITRLTAVQDRVRGLLDEASAAAAIFDALDAGRTKYADPLIKPLINSALGALPTGHTLGALPTGHHAIVECEERAVTFVDVLEQLKKVGCGMLDLTVLSVKLWVSVRWHAT